MPTIEAQPIRKSLFPFHRRCEDKNNADYSRPFIIHVPLHPRAEQRLFDGIGSFRFIANTPSEVGIRPVDVSRGTKVLRQSLKKLETPALKPEFATSVTFYLNEGNPEVILINRKRRELVVLRYIYNPLDAAIGSKLEDPNPTLSTSIALEEPK